MKLKFNLKIVLFIIFFLVIIPISLAQTNNIKIGAYYFDGWSGRTFHITEDLKLNYPEREPIWGWVTSTPEIVEEQVKAAADAGLSFFSFCWYHSDDVDPDNHRLNQALQYYKSSKYVDRLEYCLLVANHGGFEIGPENFDRLADAWLEEFHHPKYLQVEGKPILIFFEHGSLVKKFGGEAAVKKAFEELKDKAITQGLPGVTIAICAGSPQQVMEAKACGADIITGYNYHPIGFEERLQATPIQNMQIAEQKHWNKLTSKMNLKYIPVSTVGWDPRPWANEQNNYQNKPYYTGFSAQSVKKSIQGLLHWMKENPKLITKEQIGLLYAWNENGEGAWLTPGKSGLNPLEGVQEVLNPQK